MVSRFQQNLTHFPLSPIILKTQYIILNILVIALVLSIPSHMEGPHFGDEYEYEFFFFTTKGVNLNLPWNIKKKIVEII